MGQKKVSNQFTVNTVEDGQSAPYYFQEWYAWSNDPSTASVTTEPNIAGTWAESIPAQGSYAYLWRKSIRYVLNSSSNTYTPETAQYFRMSGTNGTSITPKGNALAYTDQDASEVVPNPTNGDIVLYVGSSHDDNLDKYEIYDWSTMAGSWEGYGATDGDSYVMPNGHLMMYSSEAYDWIDLGQFQGQSGKTYYTHIAWATNVIISGGVVTSVEGFVTTKSPNDTTHIWMGVLIDENSGQDSTKATTYTWSNTKGDGAAVAHASTEQISIPCNSNGSVSSQMTVTVSFSMRIGSVAASNIRVNNPSSLPTGVQYSGTSQSSGRIIISTNATASGMASGLTFAVIGSNGTKDYTSTVTIALIGVKQGSTGERGNVGRFYYYAGDWDATNSTTLFVINDAQAPFFSKAGSSLNAYYVYNPDDNPSGGEMTMAQMAEATSSGRVINWNNKPWVVMTNDFKYIITEALFGSYAHLGSWIFNDDYMISEKDRNGNPRGQQEYNGMPSNAQVTTGFIPSVAFDAANGRASFCGDWVRFNPDGSGWLSNKKLSWNYYGELTLTSAKLSGNLTLEGSNSQIRVGQTDKAYIVLTNNNYGDGSIQLVDASGVVAIQLTYDNDSGGGPSFWLRDDSVRAVIDKLAIRHNEEVYIDSEQIIFDTRINSRGLNVSKDNYTTPSKSVYIHMGVDNNNLIDFYARGGNGTNSAWPEYNYMLDPTTLNKGSVQVMSLGSLKAIFDGTYYSDRLNKLSVLIVRNNT